MKPVYITSPDKTIEVKIRIPEDTHMKIAMRATRNDRSMNKEIINILKRQK